MSKTRALLALSIIELSINRFNGVARNRNCLTLTSYHAVPLPSKKLLSATAVCCSLLHTSQQPTRKTMAHLATRMHHRPRSLRPPRQSYHTIYKFGGGPRNEAHLPEFLPPSCPPRVFPELREARSARNASWRTQLAAVCRQQSLAGEARVQGQQGRGVRVLSLMGNSSPPCVASSPCGVCNVAGCSFTVGEERERRDRPLRPRFFPSCGKLVGSITGRRSIHTLPN